MTWPNAVQADPGGEPDRFAKGTDPRHEDTVAAPGPIRTVDAGGYDTAAKVCYSTWRGGCGTPYSDGRSTTLVTKTMLGGIRQRPRPRPVLSCWPRITAFGPKSLAACDGHDQAKCGHHRSLPGPDTGTSRPAPRRPVPTRRRRSSTWSSYRRRRPRSLPAFCRPALTPSPHRPRPLEPERTTSL